jgi:hypothetical protein
VEGLVFVLNRRAGTGEWTWTGHRGGRIQSAQKASFNLLNRHDIFFGTPTDNTEVPKNLNEAHDISDFQLLQPPGVHVAISMQHAQIVQLFSVN